MRSGGRIPQGLQGKEPGRVTHPDPEKPALLREAHSAPQSTEGDLQEPRIGLSHTASCTQAASLRRYQGQEEPRLSCTQRPKTLSPQHLSSLSHSDKGLPLTPTAQGRALQETISHLHGHPCGFSPSTTQAGAPGTGRNTQEDTPRSGISEPGISGSLPNQVQSHEGQVPCRVTPDGGRGQYHI